MRDIGYLVHKIGCYFLSLVMAASIVITFALGIGMGMLRTESYVQSQMEKQNAQLLKEVTVALENTATDTGLPSKAYTQSIQSGHIQTVLHTVSSNLVYGYKTDFSDSKYLYGYFRTGILNYCKDNGIAISEDELVRYASYAVDTFNSVCGDESTRFILPFHQTYTNNPIIAIIICVIAFVISFVLLAFFNYGKHKKYDYLGAGLAAGGATLFALPTFAIIMKYSSMLHFTDVDVYNNGIADIINGIFAVYIPVGIVIMVIGLVILRMNYKYFAKKAMQAKTEHEINMKLRKEHYWESHLSEEELKKDLDLPENEDIGSI